VLAGHLIGAKLMLGTTEGMLAAAELVLTMFSKCPGLLRCGKEIRRARAERSTVVTLPFSADSVVVVAVLIASRLTRELQSLARPTPPVYLTHLALTVFKLYDQRKSYDAMRSLVVTATGKEIAPFDEFGVGVALCDSKFCAYASDILLSLPVSPPGYGASSVVPRWPDGARGDGNTDMLSQGQEGEDQQQKKHQHQHQHHQHHQHHQQQGQLQQEQQDRNRVGRARGERHRQHVRAYLVSPSTARRQAGSTVRAVLLRR